MKGHLKILLLLGASFLPGLAEACGPIWDAPINHFDGVNEQGHVSWWGKIGEVDLGANADGTPLKFPLTINFRSNRESGSPILGNGWILPLLESHFIPWNDKGIFLMVEPDGYMRFFSRSAKDENLLNGGGGWVAEVKDGVVDARAECGWRFRFLKGKLNAIFTPQNRRFDIARENGKIVLREGLEDKFTVVLDGFAGEAKTMILPDGSKIAIEHGEKPRLPAIAGATTPVGLDRAVSRISGPAGEIFRFKYGVDGGGNPSLEVNGTGKERHVFFWNNISKLALKVDEWIYQIVPAKNPDDNALIARSTWDGKKELWQNDVNKGVERSLKNGVETVITRFAAGPLAGKLRKVEEKKGGITKVLRAPIYDENNRKIRDLDPQGNPVVLSYDADGRLSSKKSEGGDETVFEYKENGETLAKTTTADGIKIIRTEVNGRNVRSEITDVMGDVTTVIYEENGSAATYFNGSLKNVRASIEQAEKPIKILYEPGGIKAIDSKTGSPISESEIQPLLKELKFPTRLP